MVSKFYKKLFDEMETAREFGKAVDYIAGETMVPGGQAGKPYPIFITCKTASEGKEIGNYYSIKKEIGIRGNDIYYVEYRIRNPDGSLKGDVLKAQRQAEAYLSAKYTEVGSDAGVSRT